jgi:hypothetical protein
MHESDLSRPSSVEVCDMSFTLYTHL